MKQLDALEARLSAVASKITALGGSTASITAYNPSIAVTPAPETTTPSYTSSPSFGLGQTAPSISITNNNTGVSTSPAEIATATLNAVLLGQTQGINTSAGLANKLKVMGVE
jgi:hypothetical protein